jgi:hypothetical protein
MTKGIPRKQRLAEQHHARRVQGAATWASAAKTPPRAFRPIATKQFRPSVGRAPSPPEPLPPAHYPSKRVAIGKRQVPGGAPA